VIAFPPKDISLEYSSVPLELISDLDITLGYVKGAFRIYDNKIYETLTVVDPLVKYIWYDEDTSNIYGRDIHNDIDISDPTSVPVVNNVTAVYVQSNQHYYIAKVTGNVDFTIEDIVNPANFTDLGLTPDYRISYNYPNGKKNTLYWKYIKSTNGNTMFDGSLNKQTTNDRQISGTNFSFDSATKTITNNVEMTNIYDDDKIVIVGADFNTGEYTIDTVSVDKLSFTVLESLTDEPIGANINIATYTYIKFTERGIDKISFFNTQCDEIEVKTTIDTVKTIYTFDMIATDHIIDFESFCFDEIEQLNRYILTIPRDYAVEFEITYKGNTQDIGELMIGSSMDMGKAEDKTTIGGRSYGEIIETDDGEVYFDEIDSQLKIVEKVNYTIVIPTNELESQNEKNKSLLNKRLVLAGSPNDEGELRYLITYGFGKDYTLMPKSTETHSSYKFEFRSFI